MSNLKNNCPTTKFETKINFQNNKSVHNKYPKLYLSINAMSKTISESKINFQNYELVRYKYPELCLSPKLISKTMN